MECYPDKHILTIEKCIRDHMEIPQVLFVFPSEKGGRGLRPAGNTKPEEKLEEKRWLAILT